MKKYDVAIVGGGPAGVFAAYELIEKNPALKIIVLESGNDIYKRVCPISTGKVKGCIGCKLCYSVCPQKCIDITNKPVVIDQHHCLHCGRCAETCPKQVIEKRA